MGQIGIWQIVLVVVLAVLLFGRGKISQVMGDVAKGINSFKRGMKEGAEDDTAERKLEDGQTIDVTAKETKAGSSNG